MARLGVATHFRRDDGWVRWTLPLALAFVLAMGTVALADNAGVDGDFATAGLQNMLAFGELCPESDATTEAAHWYVVRSGGAQQNNYQNSSTVTFELRQPNAVVIDSQPVDGDSGLGFAFPGSGTVTLPENWVSLGNGTLSDPAVVGNVTVTPGATAGSYTGDVKMKAFGPNQQNGAQISNNADLTVTWTVLEADDPACASVDYHFTGFYEPVGGNSNDDDFFVTAKAGQGIALKWNLYEFEDGPEIVDPAGYSASSTRFSCTLTGTGDDQPVADDAGTSGFRYSESDGQNIFVWKTLKNWASTCRTFVLSYNDGSGPVAVAWLDVHFTK